MNPLSAVTFGIEFLFNMPYGRIFILLVKSSVADP
jgi:hypothetical protein